MSHVRFCLAYCAVMFAAWNAPNAGRLARWFRDGDAFDVPAFAAYLLAAFCLFVAIFALMAHRHTVKFFSILLILLGGAATYFIVKYGVFIDSAMILNAVHTDPVEVGQLWSWQMAPYAILLIAIPIAAVVFVDIRFEPRARYLIGSSKLFAIAFAVALAALALEYRAIFRAGNASSKAIVYTLVPLNVISGSINAAGKSLRPWFVTDQKDLVIDAKVATPRDLVVVLAVGESSRRRNFSLYGYERRETNPVLSGIEGLHRLNANATRASTLYALPKILEKNGVKLTTLVSKAGIPTVCYVNYTLYDNCAAVGEKKPGSCAHDRCYDEDVLPMLDAELRTYRAGYRFVVLHLGGGSHGPLYADRHPPEFRRFVPTCDDADVANRCTREALLNSYDNTILYADHVLGRAIETLDRSRVPYVFLYLSDHGESLGEEGRLFHGVPPGMPLPVEQAEIPLLVKSSVPIGIESRTVYQQSDVFDSILALLTIESPGFDKSGAFIEASPR